MVQYPSINIYENVVFIRVTTTPALHSRLLYIYIYPLLLFLAHDLMNSGLGGAFFSTFLLSLSLFCCFLFKKINKIKITTTTRKIYRDGLAPRQPFLPVIVHQVLYAEEREPFFCLLPLFFILSLFHTPSSIHYFNWYVFFQTSKSTSLYLLLLNCY